MGWTIKSVGCCGLIALPLGWGCGSGGKRTVTAAEQFSPATGRALFAPNAEAGSQGDEEASESGGRFSTSALSVQFQIWRFQIDRAHQVDPSLLWNQLDESVMAPGESLILRRNGIRVGAGKESAWPAVRAVLLDCEPQVWRNSVSVSGGRPMIMELSGLAEGEPLFYFDDQDRLIGSSRPAGSICIRVDHDWDPGDEQLSLSFVPEIHRAQSDLEQRLARAAPLPGAEEIEQVSALAFSVVLAPAHYLVIGPGESAKMSRLIGSLSLTDHANGRWFENIYCIVPTISRRPMPGFEQPPGGQQGGGDG